MTSVSNNGRQREGVFAVRGGLKNVKVFLWNRRNFIKSGVEGNNQWRAICCGICVFLLLECFMAWDGADSGYGSL